MGLGYTLTCEIGQAVISRWQTVDEFIAGEEIDPALHEDVRRTWAAIAREVAAAPHMNWYIPAD